jgi:hypothetical protein
MNSLSFPDTNLWLALAAPEHVHAALLALAQEAAGVLVKFDQALASRGAYCLLSK